MKRVCRRHGCIFSLIQHGGGDLYTRFTLTPHIRHTDSHTHGNDTALRWVNPDRGLFFYKSPLSFLSIAQNVLPQDELTETHKLEYSATHVSAGRTVSFLTQPAGFGRANFSVFSLSRDPMMIK